MGNELFKHSQYEHSELELVSKPIITGIKIEIFYELILVQFASISKVTKITNGHRIRRETI